MVIPCLRPRYTPEELARLSDIEAELSDLRFRLNALRAERKALSHAAYERELHAYQQAMAEQCQADVSRALKRHRFLRTAYTPSK